MIFFYSFNHSDHHLVNHILFSWFQKSTSRLAEDVSLAELATIAPEQPSPVSVLDASVYRDDAPSPVKQTPTALKGNFLLFWEFAT